tara:strand:+ start:1056 stop:1502 length:447 start_codon:yes stop_codon:yes gene_type:complete
MTTRPPKTKIIFLTKAEALFIDDAFTVLTDREGMQGISGMRPLGPSAILAAPPDLIERLGMAVLLTTSDDGLAEAAVEVDDAELYMLREVAQSNVKYLEENVGYNLKRKIYLALLEDDYNDSLQFAKLMADMDVDSVQARNKAKTNFS